MDAFSTMPTDPLETEFGRPMQAAVREDDDAPNAEMRGRITTEAALLRFIMAGRAVLTVRSNRTGQRFTLRFSRPEETPGRARPIWVSLLSGPDNTASYEFLGTVWPNPGQWNFNRSSKSRVSDDAPSVRAVRWLARMINLDPTAIFRQAELWHEGRCGRCGRRLTVPESIETGFGPECAGRVGL